MIGWIIAGSIIGAIVIILIISVIVMYNNLVERSVRVDNAWSQIDVQMKQRYDLIPNLVETVKAYASHEKSTLEEVTKWRAAAMEAKTPEELMQSNQKLSGAIANIFATAENYPDLKANDNFLDLQRQLKELEEKIAFARQFYNDTVMKYNEYLQRFILLQYMLTIFKYKERPYFEMNEAEKAVLKVWTLIHALLGEHYDKIFTHKNWNFSGCNSCGFCNSNTACYEQY